MTESSLCPQLRVHKGHTQIPVDHANTLTEPPAYEQKSSTGTVCICDEHTHTGAASQPAILISQKAVSRKRIHLIFF